MKAILKREFKSYFSSAGGYLFLGIFLLAVGFFFVYNIFDSVMTLGYPTTAMRNLFAVMPMLLAVMVPLITMGSFADERKQKTDQLLLTSPNSVTSIVLGKFFGAFSFVGVCVATTLLYLIVFYIYGTPNLMLVIMAYLAVLFLAALYTAVGIFFSSLTESSLIAAIVSILAILICRFLGNIAGFSLLPQAVTSVFGLVNPEVYYNLFYSELLSVQPFVYFISLTALFLFLTIRVVESRRWK